MIFQNDVIFKKRVLYVIIYDVMTASVTSVTSKLWHNCCLITLCKVSSDYFDK